MFDKVIIAPIAFALLIFMSVIMLPYLMWMAWGRIIALKRGS